MRLLDKEEIIKYYRDKENQFIMFKYFEKSFQQHFLNEKQYQEAKDIMNNIFRLRQNQANIDKNFQSIFSEKDTNKYICDSANMGADIGGIEINKKIILCMNIELGVNFSFFAPRLEDSLEYIEDLKNISHGLNNPTEFKVLYNYNNLNYLVDNQNIKNKTKDKVSKI